MRRERILALVAIVLVLLITATACGKSEQLILCQSCSKEVSVDNQFCPNCGVSLIVEPSSDATTEGTTASESTKATEAEPTETPQTPEKETQEPTQAPTTNKEESKKPSHTHKYSSATCTSPKTCSCGATSGKALGHSWKNATCTAPKTCSRCGTISGKAISHSYSKAVTAPTCKDKGYTTYTCSVCGDSYKDDYVSASHQYKDYKCTDCGKVDKDHAYEYLIAWVKENGKADGSYREFTYKTTDYMYQLSYSAQYGNIAVNLGRISGEPLFASLQLDSFYYGVNLDDHEMCGYINASSFTSNTAISYTRYTGDNSSKPLIAELSRVCMCQLIDWLEWFLDAYDIGITVSDLGFTSW